MIWRKIPRVLVEQLQILDYCQNICEPHFDRKIERDIYILLLIISNLTRTYGDVTPK